ncbi:MAG: ATPase [Alphaproteobacteria bacterium]|nr:ATPase [Alphaproteobacteria bacterium]
MKKFYKLAEAGTAPGGYTVRLDGKPVKTPLKHPLLLESRSLAEAIVLEWAGQGNEIKPTTMPLTQLTNTMIDKSKGDDRAEMEEQLLEYGGSDLLCYFATHPETLVKQQQAHWLPLLGWMQEKYGIVFKTVAGIQYHHQPQESLDKLEKLINGLDAADFTVVQAASATTGSVMIALALLAGKISPEEAYRAACVDEIYQLETWGEDAEARKRLNIIQSELKSIAQFRDLVKASL